MASSITVNGNTYSDGDDPATGMGNGGFRTRLLPMLSDTIADLGRNMVTTSTTPVAIGTGSKAFTMAAAIPFAVGAFVEIASAADGANWMWGQVTARSDTGLTVDVAVTGGSGTMADWNIQKSGVRGPTGDVTGPESSTDNALVRWDGAGGSAVQDSGWVIDDSDNMSAGGALDMADEALTRALVSDLAEAVHNLGTLSAGTTDVDLTDGPVQTAAGGAVSKTFTISNWPPVGSGTVVLVITNGGLFSSIDWPVDQWAGGGNPPDLTVGGVDLVVITRIGGIRFGFCALDFQA